MDAAKNLSTGERLLVQAGINKQYFRLILSEVMMKLNAYLKEQNVKFSLKKNKMESFE